MITGRERQGVDGIPSSAGGVVKELKVKLGDKVSQGSAILVLEATSASAAPPAAERGRPGCQG